MDNPFPEHLELSHSLPFLRIFLQTSDQSSWMRRSSPNSLPSTGWSRFLHYGIPAQKSQGLTNESQENHGINWDGGNLKIHPIPAIPAFLQPGIGCWNGNFHWPGTIPSTGHSQKKFHGSRTESPLTSQRRAPGCREGNSPGRWWISSPRKSSRRDRTGKKRGKIPWDSRIGSDPKSHPSPK